MAKIRFVLNKSNIRRDGTCPVCLRITQNGRLKYIDLGLSATVEQWNVETERFKKDRRVVSCTVTGYLILGSQFINGVLGVPCQLATGIHAKYLRVIFYPF